MPRLIILLLALVSVALLTIQNMATTVPVVVLSKSLPAMSLGILLATAVGIGALLTLVLYGLVGLRRPPESKYRPMGRRVPYPETPDSAPAPYAGPSAASDSFTGTSSSAFVTSSPASAPVTPTQPPAQSKASPPVQDSFGGSLKSTVTKGGTNTESTGPSVDTAETSKSTDVSDRTQPPATGLKSVFGKKKDRSQQSANKRKDNQQRTDNQQSRSEKRSENRSGKRVGDGWGELRTTAQRDSWDTSESDSSPLETGAKSLFNFGRNVSTQAGQIADDIAKGWSTRNPRQTNPSTSEYGADRYGADRYGADSSESYADGSESYYADDTYYTGNRSEGYDTATGYSVPPTDGLDRGWESFDNYDNPPPNEAAPARRPIKQNYGDDLYGHPGSDLDEEEGVYDADYRVIVPPSKPLDDPADEDDLV